MSIKELYSLYKKHPIICTDTRNIQPSCIFFCLKGDFFNGNTFAYEAIKQGSAYVILDEKEYIFNDQCILVDNVLQILQDLALYHRKQLHIPFIGITGTNGKTTTKELINSVLSEKYKVLATYGNLNNHIGVPLTILSINNNVDIAVIEMGANHAHEIEDLCKIALPNYGIITNIGKAHLEGFGSIETIIETKTALYRTVQQANGSIFVNCDDTLLIKYTGKDKVITYGKQDSAHYVGQLVSDPLICKVLLPKTQTLISTQLIGAYNFYNILAAIAVGETFKISLTQIQHALANYTPSNSRSQLLRKGTNTFIMDAYNANPASMELAIRNFANIKHDNKILILGDMKELGNESIEEHKQIMHIIETYAFNQVYLIGEEFSSIPSPVFQTFDTFEKAAKQIQNQNIQNSIILIKGSRAMKMERFLDVI